MTFGTWFVNETNALTYKVCTLGIQSKRYKINNLVVSVTNVVTTYMQLLHVTYAILTFYLLDILNIL